MSETMPIRPSAWYYLLAVPFLLMGMSFFFYTLLHDILHITDSLTQVVVPGEANLTLKHGVAYTVFYEQQSVVNGVIYSANETAEQAEVQRQFRVPRGCDTPQAAKHVHDIRRRGAIGQVGLGIFHSTGWTLPFFLRIS
jgi:hypothetical protein